MKDKKYRVIGVMSGTSLDGVDLVLVEFTIGARWTFKIIESETVPYDETLQNALRGLVSLSLQELKKTDEAYTFYLSAVITSFIIKYNIKDIDAVCSHGHTALHRPEKHLTYQIGNLVLLAKFLNRKVVCDFRIQDVILGGQGAPLVPIGDKLLFSEYDFCLNLGGFANISTDISSERIAYDICPVNIVLNYYTRKLGVDYDDKGIRASSGIIHNELLDRLNDLAFYRENHPKSLGLEWVEKKVFPLIDSFKLTVPDVLRTFVEHVATQLSIELNKKHNASVLITGGGVYNDFLIKQLKLKTTSRIIIPSKELVEFKEAIIFGFLGVLKMRNENNCLKSVTGAFKDHCSGVVFEP